MAQLVQFSDLRISAFSQSTDLVPIIRPNLTASGYSNLKASLANFIPDSSSYAALATTSSYTVSSSYSTTSSYSATSVSASHAITSSNSIASLSASYSISSSYALNSTNALSASVAVVALNILSTSSFVPSASYSYTSSQALTASYIVPGLTSSYTLQYLNQPFPIYAYRMWSAENFPNANPTNCNASPAWNNSLTALNIINNVTYYPATTISNNMSIYNIPTFKGEIDLTPYGSGLFINYRMYGVRVYVNAGYTITWATRYADNYLNVFLGPSWSGGVYGGTSTLLGYILNSGTLSWTAASSGLYTFYFVIWNAPIGTDYNNPQINPIGLHLNEWIDGVNVQFSGIPGITIP